VAHDLCWIFLVAGGTDKRHRDLVSAFDHVIVGEDVPTLVDDEAGAGALGELPLGRTLTGTLTGLIRRLAAEEAAQEVIATLAAEEFGQVLGALARFGADVHDGRNLRLGDIPKRRGVDRAAKRRAVHRGHGHHLRR
jgi:hypothetical protein